MVENGVSEQHTPLETLLFFQALRAHDLANVDFAQISNDLHKLPIITQDVAFDSARLSAEALQRLYLNLLAQEAVVSKDATIGQLQNGDSNGSGNKRKAASPALPSLEAAFKQRHLLPGLLYRLYLKYREAVVAEIRAEEDFIDALELRVTDTEQDDASITQTIHESNAKRSNTRPGDDRMSGPIPNGNVTSPSTQAQPLPATARARSTLPDTATQPQATYNVSSQLQQGSPRMQQYGSPAVQLEHSSSPSMQQSSAGQSPTTLHRALTRPAGLPIPTQASPVIMHSGFQPPPHRGHLPVHPMYTGQTQRPPSANSSIHTRGQSPQQQAQSQTYQIRPSQQGGFQLPPFQVAAQDPSKVSEHYQNQSSQAQAQPRSGPNPAPSRPQVASASSLTSSSPRTPQVQHTAPDADSLTQSVLSSLRKRSSTGTWKSQETRVVDGRRSPKAPIIEPISPVRRHAALRTGSTTQRNIAESAVEDETDGVELAKQRRTSLKRSARAPRASSVGSSGLPSSTGQRTRSQSVMSQSADTAASAFGRKVKADPETHAEEREDEHETPAPSRTTRSRRDTLQPPTTVLSSGRRSTPRLTPRQESQIRVNQPRPRGDVVHVTRNFNRLSSAILNEIIAHRHAGPFQKPVSAKDVQGYAEMIKRPMDLKSIKAAVTAGSRAVNAAFKARDEAEADTLADDDGDATMTTTSAGTVTMPKTLDLVPPRGIVNSAQLEREVMRMFANAVMFNTGDQGFVKDARDMAEDVSKKMADWREFELGMASAADDEGEAAAKRRKL